MLQITPAATNPRFTERSMWNTFRVCGRDDQQGAVAGATSPSASRARNRHRPRQDHLRPGPRRRDQEGNEQGRHARKCLRGVNNGEKDFSALVSKMKAASVDLVYSAACTPRRADRAPDARPGRQGAPDGRRRHHHDEFGLAGPGVEGTLMTFGPDPRKNPTPRRSWRSSAPRIRAGGLHALHLRRHADHQAGGGEGQDARHQESRRGDAVRQKFKTVLGDLLRQEGRHHRAGLRHGTSGRRSPARSLRRRCRVRLAARGSSARNDRAATEKPASRSGGARFLFSRSCRAPETSRAARS